MSARESVVCKRHGESPNFTWSYLDIRTGRDIQRQGASFDENGLPALPSRPSQAIEVLGVEKKPGPYADLDQLTSAPKRSKSMTSSQTQPCRELLSDGREERSVSLKSLSPSSMEAALQNTLQQADNQRLKEAESLPVSLGAQSAGNVLIQALAVQKTVLPESEQRSRSAPSPASSELPAKRRKIETTPGHYRVSTGHTDLLPDCEPCHQPPVGMGLNLCKEGLQNDNVAEEEPEDPEDAEGSSRSDDEGTTLGTNAIYDPACCECDDGGIILMCDGPCLRSFHAGMRDSEEEGGESQVYDAASCNPVNIPPDLFEALTQQGSERFNCPNCLAGVQQCFVCKKEGKADSEVFRCSVVNCGKYYHLKCIQKSKTDNIPTITCGLHCCAYDKCEHMGKDFDKGELIPCRRCPIAYHQRCLPRDLQMNNDGRVWIAEFDEKGTCISSVERSLIYCMKHTPRKNAFPHKRPLFTKELLHTWRLQYCKHYPELKSSKDYFAQAFLKNTISATDLEDLPLQLRMVISREKRRQSIAASVQSPPSGSRGCVPTHKRLGTDPRAVSSSVSSPRNVRSKPLNLSSEAVAMEVIIAEQPQLLDPCSPARPMEPATTADKAGNLVPLAGPVDQSLDTSHPYSADANEGDNDLLHPLFPFEQEEHWSEEAVVDRVMRDMEKAMDICSMPTIRAKMRVVKPYDSMPNKSFQDGLLDSILAAARVKDQTGELMDPAYVTMTHEGIDKMRHVLAPFLHAQRYTSYGRHFTRSDRLTKLCTMLMPFLRADDVVVDFSCGSNDWLHMLKRMCLVDGFAIHCKAFDIITPFHMDDFNGAKSWFDVTKDDLRVSDVDVSADRLVIGLNPPFGKNSSLANQFVLYAAEKFQPRMLVLIVPPITQIPQGYDTLLEDVTIMKDKSFHIPGLNEKNSASWNKDVPCIRFLVRQKHLAGVLSLDQPHMEALVEETCDPPTIEQPLQQHLYDYQPHQPYEHFHQQSFEQPQPWFAPVNPLAQNSYIGLDPSQFLVPGYANEPLFGPSF